MLDQKETKNLRTGFPASRKPYTGDCDYDADSDLEEDEDCNFSDNEGITHPEPENSEGKSDKSDSSTLVHGQSPDSKGNKSSDIISVSDVDSFLSDSVETKTEDKSVTTTIHVGNIIVVEDVAFVT